MTVDPRRTIPRTDALLADERFVEAANRLGSAVVKASVVDAQNRARAGELAPTEVADAALAALPADSTTMRRVINATGVVVHTNIGRAPLGPAARNALATASGYVDVEFDPAAARRAARGRGALAALRERVPNASGALVVNNGAAALLLSCLTLTAGRSLVVSRGELVEIGDGFRLPELLQSAGIRLHEVGTTNRTHLRDYEAALPEAGAILKVHTSNYRVEGFAGVPGVKELSGLGVPVIADVGSGLLAPERALPDEPDAATWLADGATVVTASGDKLLGGPQAGLVLGDADAVERIRRHPMARAMRTDKLTLAALEATLRGPVPPVLGSLRHTRDSLRERTEILARRVGGEVVDVEGRVGGGGAPGVPLPSLAVALPHEVADALRRGEPCVVARVAGGRCLVDLRCVPEESDDELADAIAAVTRAQGA